MEKLILKANNLDEVYNSFTISQGANEILDHSGLKDFDDTDYGDENDTWEEFLYLVNKINSNGVKINNFKYKVNNKSLLIYKIY